MKRVLDLTISISLLVLFIPLCIVIALLIYLQMGSPVIFKQKRPGLNGEPFYLFKYRTMSHIRDHLGNLLSDTERLTPLGEKLRRYSLDELPQLVNVIKGDMSLVGPRPLLLEYLALYTEEQSTRNNVKPGITGWAQINGRNGIEWEEKFKLDVWYVKNQTIWLDIKILMITLIKVFKKDGISQRNHVTMEKFKGSKEVI